MTGKSVELVEGLILKPGAYGRRTYSATAKRALVELCKAPGTSVAGLALAHGVNANLLRRWITRYASEATSHPRAALLPVRTSLPSAPARPASTEGYIEISFRAATIRVRGPVDARALGTVLDCLARRV